MYFKKSVLIFTVPSVSDTILRISAKASIISYGRSDYGSYGNSKKGTKTVLVNVSEGNMNGLDKTIHLSR